MTDNGSVTDNDSVTDNGSWLIKGVTIPGHGDAADQHPARQRFRHGHRARA